MIFMAWSRPSTFDPNLILKLTCLEPSVVAEDLHETTQTFVDNLCPTLYKHYWNNILLLYKNYWSNILLLYNHCWNNILLEFQEKPKTQELSCTDNFQRLPTTITGIDDQL